MSGRKQTIMGKARAGIRLSPSDNALLVAYLLGDLTIAGLLWLCMLPLDAFARLVGKRSKYRPTESDGDAPAGRSVVPIGPKPVRAGGNRWPGDAA